MMTTSYHITVESTRDIAARSIHRKHLDRIHFVEIQNSCDIHDNDGDYDELDDDNLGASPTAMTQVDTPVLDVTFRLLRKSHHLEKKKIRRAVVKSPKKAFSDPPHCT